MAKLSALVKAQPIPTNIAGMYVRDLPAKQVEEAFGDLEESFKADAPATIVKLFNELLCDEDGEKFEDVSTYDEITDSLSLTSINEIIKAIPEALNPSADTKKKSSPRGKRK